MSRFESCTHKLASFGATSRYFSSVSPLEELGEGFELPEDKVMCPECVRYVENGLSQRDLTKTRSEVIFGAVFRVDYFRGHTFVFCVT